MKEGAAYQAASAGQQIGREQWNGRRRPVVDAIAEKPRAKKAAADRARA